MALTVPEALQGYVTSGLLRNFHPVGRTGEFEFLWLNHTPMRVQWKPAGRTIVFKDVVPNVAARGPMDREIRDFLKGLTDEALPDHRRVDPAEFELSCQNRQSRVSVGLRFIGGDEESAVHKLMLVMHELFLFLHDRWPDYMHEEFGASLE